MVRIRMRRVGARNQPSFRIVAADRESPRDGRFLEAIGFYNPRTQPSTIQIDEARLFHWMQHGAQPSESVVQTLTALGTWDRWERFKAGEPIEKLVEEAGAAVPEVDPRTRRDDLIGQPSKKRKRKEKQAAEAAQPAAAAEAAEPEAEAPEAEAEPEAEAQAEEAPEAEAEAEAETEAQAEEAPEAEAEAEAAAEEQEAPEAEAEQPEAEAEADEPEAETEEGAADDTDEQADADSGDDTEQE